jgi:nucleotide-binding universal stress UspA family protein
VDNQAPMISNVAVATDGSATAGEAVNQATEIARQFGAKLWLLSAFEKLPSGDQNVELQWTRSSSAQVKSLLEKLEADLGAADVECETRVDEGDPAEVIVRLATEVGADLLVIGNIGMQRRVLSSVPNTVTHKAPCSVLVVKTT